MPLRRKINTPRLVKSQGETDRAFHTATLRFMASAVRIARDLEAIGSERAARDYWQAAWIFAAARLGA